ncbi:MAG: hypothetical protein LUG49_00280 [Oscillospiraceae bacterium]|nr:hypothetical protein [Oscillospiraceae bacterium]
MSSITQNYKAAFEILKKKPILLWGLSLLSNFIILIVSLLGGARIITFPVALVLEASLAVLYLKGVRGEGIETKNIFSGFTSLKQAVHVAGGMLWMELWILLWGLIPIVGIVFAVIKTYEYAFTPYILITRPEIGAMDALKESKKMTKGWKGKMFGAQALVIVAIWLCALILGIFSAIPFIGGLFGLVLFLLIVAVVLFCPIFFGLVSAKFYEDALYTAAHPAPVQPMPQPQQYNFDPYTGQPIQPQVQPIPPTQPAPTPAPAPAPEVQPIPPTQPAPVYNPGDEPVVNQNPTPAPEAPTDDNQPTRI